MNITSVLNSIYDSAINGNATALANEYIRRYGRTDEAIDRLVANQRRKCTLAGIVTGLGGVITLPVTLPADLVSSLIMQINMIVAIAIIRGYDVESEEIRTLVFLCIIGNSIGDVLKQAGVKVLTNYTAKTILPKLTQAVSKKVVLCIGRNLCIVICTTDKCAKNRHCFCRTREPLRR